MKSDEWESVVLRTIIVGLIPALALHYGSLGIWLISGFPPGYIPDLDELTPGSLLAWRLLTILYFLQYFFYGALCIVMLIRVRVKVTRREAILYGAIVGAVIALILRILQAISLFLTMPSQETLRLDYLIGVAGGTITSIAL